MRVAAIALVLLARLAMASECESGCTVAVPLVAEAGLYPANDVEQVTHVYTKRYGQPDGAWDAEPACQRIREHGWIKPKNANSGTSYVRNWWDVCDVSTGYPGKSTWGYRSNQQLGIGWMYECTERDTRCFSWQTNQEYDMNDCARYAHLGAREQLMCVDPDTAGRPLPYNFAQRVNWEQAHDVKLTTVVGLRFPNVPIPYNATVTRAWISFTGVADPLTGGGLNERADIDFYLDPRPTSSDAKAGRVFAGRDAGSAYDTRKSRSTVVHRNESAPSYGPHHLPADALKIVGNHPVTWSDVPVFHPTSQYQSADISSLVQRKVRTPGWKFRDALAIVVDATTGRRVIASTEHHIASGAGSAPVLHVHYTGGMLHVTGAKQCKCDPAEHPSTHTTCQLEKHTCNFNHLNHRSNMPAGASSSLYWSGDKKPDQCTGSSTHTTVRVTHHKNHNQDFHRCAVVNRGTSAQRCACCDCLNGIPSKVEGCRKANVNVRDAGQSFHWLSTDGTDKSWDAACSTMCQGPCSASHGVVTQCTRDAAWVPQGTLTDYWDSAVGQISFGGAPRSPDGKCRLGGSGKNLFQCKCVSASLSHPCKTHEMLGHTGLHRCASCFDGYQLVKGFCFKAQCPNGQISGTSCTCNAGYYGGGPWVSGLLYPECKPHKTCGAGQKMMADGTASSDRQCASCAGDTFQSAVSHTSVTCQARMMCGKGQKVLSNGSFTTDRQCASCDGDTFQTAVSHTSATCKARKLCSMGHKMISNGSFTANRECSECDAHTYQPSPSHRDTTCIAQPTCHAGQKISADSKTARRTCNACPANSYQSSNNHREISCITQTTCGAGQMISADTKLAPRVCSTCPVNTFQTLPNHRHMNCAPQPTCGAGQKMSIDTKTARRTCSTCADNTYQSATSHRKTLCEAQAKCAAGQRISVDTKHARRTCSACPIGRFQSASGHRDMDCAAWDVCVLGESCQSRTPSTSVNRVCTAVNVCTGTEYMLVAPTLEHNACGTCAAHTSCSDAQYESLQETATSDRECKIKQCTECAHGTMATGTACAIHGGTTCSSCDDGYYLSAGICVEQPLCGPGQKISAYSTTVAGVCSACDENKYQDMLKHRNKSCKAHVMDCNAQGKVISVAASSTADAVCGAEKRCHCPNGTPATGTACPGDGLPKCTACNGATGSSAGYHLRGDSSTGVTNAMCQLDQCTCPHGGIATGAACTSNGAHICQAGSCHSGYHMENSQCVRTLTTTTTTTSTTMITTPVPAAATTTTIKTTTKEPTAKSPGYPNPAWSKGWCDNWKQLPDQHQPGYKEEFGRTFYHKPVGPSDCAAKCIAHPDCTQAVYEEGGPWGQECWLGGQTSTKVHRNSRVQGENGTVDHCFHPGLVP